MNRENLLLSAAKPSRYLGAEVNAARKGENVKLRFVLAFPDAYEVGMSHLGIQILYSLLNDLPEVACELCFCPWPDMEQLLRKHRLPLISLESQRPLHVFDIVGFSFQYELSYTNVLNMLELGGIPLRREDRGESSPIVIAGGPCAFNPLPMNNFIDAFVIGEGEEAILEIAACSLNAKREGRSREETLAALAVLDGVYAPAIHKGKEKIKKRVVSDLNLWPLPEKPVVPIMKIIHDRITIEIARGCTRGCRFCQAGMVWRPVRERRQDVLEKAADSLLCATGYDEISLLSLSSGDYSKIEPLLTVLAERYFEKRIALALPSLRVETLTKKLMENISRVRKTSFTIAPEAGTQRLRNIINKGNTEEELLATVKRVFEVGWRSVKLYFMIGLPEERNEDLDGIVELAYQAMKEGKKRGQVTISLSSFVPKPHTPFQWQNQLYPEEIREKQSFLKERIRNRNLSLKWHDYRMTMLEGMFSRGDEKTGAAIEEAFRLGCRFDGWADMLRFDLWEEAISQAGICIEDYFRERNYFEELPWDIIDCGVSKPFLISEQQKAIKGELTPDCRFTDCHACGVCDHETIKIITAASSSPSPDKDESVKKAFQPAMTAFSDSVSMKAIETWRIKFIKTGKASLLSHLEVYEALVRAIRRSGILFAYSKGCHPHPRISFASATAVGMGSLDEYADIVIESQGEIVSPDAINAFLPEGLDVAEMKRPALPKSSLAESVRGFSYVMHFPEEMFFDLPILRDRIERFLSSESFSIARETKGGSVARNVRAFVSSMLVEEVKRDIMLSVIIDKNGTVKPIELLTEVLGISNEVVPTIRILRTHTHFSCPCFNFSSIP
jgi:radical SAM family uncharacterized protein/radical SAM-linked protein